MYLDLDLNRNDDRPRSIADCLKPGGLGIDLLKYQHYMSYESDRSRRRITHLISKSYHKEKKSNKRSYTDDDALESVPPEKKTRRKRAILARRTEDGELEVIGPKQSLWYQMYVDNCLVAEESTIKTSSVLDSDFLIKNTLSW